MDGNLSSSEDSYRKGCGFPHPAARVRVVSNSSLRQLQMAEGPVADIVQLLPPIMAYARVISQEQRAIVPSRRAFRGFILLIRQQHFPEQWMIGSLLTLCGHRMVGLWSNWAFPRAWALTVWGKAWMRAGNHGKPVVKRH